jgi:hypothetical protein
MAKRTPFMFPIDTDPERRVITAARFWVDGRVFHEAVELPFDEFTRCRWLSLRRALIRRVLQREYEEAVRLECLWREDENPKLRESASDFSRIRRRLAGLLRGRGINLIPPTTKVGA